MVAIWTFADNAKEEIDFTWAEKSQCLRWIISCRGAKTMTINAFERSGSETVRGKDNPCCDKSAEDRFG